MGGGQDTDVKHDTVTAGKFTLPPPSARPLSLSLSHPAALREVVLVGMCLIWQSFAICLLSECACCTCVYVSVYFYFIINSSVLQVTFKIGSIRFYGVGCLILSRGSGPKSIQIHTFFLNMCSGRSNMINKIITSSMS